MKTNNKTFSQRIWFGIKSGWDMPILPDHIIKLERENIYIKIYIQPKEVKKNNRRQKHSENGRKIGQ